MEGLEEIRVINLGEGDKFHNIIEVNCFEEALNAWMMKEYFLF